MMFNKLIFTTMFALFCFLQVDFLKANDLLTEQPEISQESNYFDEGLSEQPEISQESNYFDEGLSEQSFEIKVFNDVPLPLVLTEQRKNFFENYLKTHKTKVLKEKLNFYKNFVQDVETNLRI